MKSQQQLFARLVQGLKPGTLSWIGLRPDHKAAMTPVNTVMAIEKLGLEGDHRCKKTPGSGRQVTIISEEYIQQTAHYMGLKNIPADLLRRNLVVKNINLTALRYQQFSIGEAIFEATALCHPCSRMEKALGKGAVAAMLGHGGLCAKIIQGGQLQVGDAVTLILPEAPA